MKYVAFSESSPDGLYIELMFYLDESRSSIECDAIPGCICRLGIDVVNVDCSLVES